MFSYCILTGQEALESRVKDSLRIVVENRNISRLSVESNNDVGQTACITIRNHLLIRVVGQI